MLTVSARNGKVHVQQNRFWERGRLVEEKDNVLWYPHSIVSRLVVRELILRAGRSRSSFYLEKETVRHIQTLHMFLPNVQLHWKLMPKTS
jgi:hypothetical protein